MEFTWDLYPAFRVLGYPIRYYSIVFALVFLVGYALARWQIMRGGGRERAADLILMGGIFAVLIGGRIAHVVFYEFDRFIADPLLLIRFWEGGLASHGSGVGLLLWIWIVARMHGAPFLDATDRLSFAGAFGAAMVRIGNFFNSEIVGRLTDQTWGVRFPRYEGRMEDVPLRHPSQFYEFGLGMLALAVLLAVDRKFGEDRPRGLLSAVFFAVYFTGRFFVEYFKEYQAFSPDVPMTMGQVLSIGPAVLGYVGIVWAIRRDAPAGWSADSRSDPPIESE